MGSLAYEPTGDVLMVLATLWLRRAEETNRATVTAIVTVTTIPSVSVVTDYNFIESPVSGLSESDYLPVEELEHEAFGDGESNCSSVRNAPAMRTISLEELQRKAGARRR